MLQIESFLNVNDNSNIEKVKIISIYNKKYVVPGHFVYVAVKLSKKNKTVDKKYLSIIIGTKYKLKRKNGFYVSFDNNLCFIVKDKENFLGNKFEGPLHKNCSFLKMAEMSFLSKCIV